MTTPDEPAVTYRGLEMADAMRKWSDRREHLTWERARMICAAWDSGVRNVSLIARLMGVSRGTIYSDLRLNGRINETPTAVRDSRLVYLDQEVDIMRAIHLKNLAVTDESVPVRMKIVGGDDLVVLEIDNYGDVKIIHPQGATPVVESGFLVAIRLPD